MFLPRMKRNTLFLISILAICGSAFARNDGTTAPEIIVDQYIELHNTHQLNSVMKLYAADATFVLNMGREPVKGREAIRELERFDVYANSTVQPYGLTYERRGSDWVVHLLGVIEHSDVFSALGMVIVQAEATRNAFVISGDLIRVVTQPELKAACRKIATAGFAAMTMWLVETDDPRASDVAPAGKLRLVPGTIPLAVSAINDWRQATGWAPAPADVRQCATP